MEYGSGPDDADVIDRERDTEDRPAVNQTLQRRFDGVALATENAATQALTAKAVADIQARWVMAMRRPRDMDEVRQVLRRACKRPEFAKAAIYALPRGGKKILGLTIRFAEEAMTAMGNMTAEAQTIYNGDDERVIRVACTNLETNATWTRDITVEKTKITKELRRGQRPLRTRTNSVGELTYVVEAEDGDVQQMESAMVSKASRTCILRLIPASLKNECFELCRKTMADEDAKDPDAARKAVVDGFDELNVKATWIAEWLGHPIDEATPAELGELRLVYRAIREGEATPAEVLAVAGDARARAAELTKKSAKEAAAKEAAAETAKVTGQNGGDARASGQAADGKFGGGPPKTGGAGAAAAKAKVAQQARPAQVQPQGAPAPAAAPVTTAAPAAARQDQPAQGSLEVAAGSSSATELRNCDMCSGPMEVPAGSPLKVRCEACRNS